MVGPGSYSLALRASLSPGMTRDVRGANAVAHEQEIETCADKIIRTHYFVSRAAAGLFGFDTGSLCQRVVNRALPAIALGAISRQHIGIEPQ